MAAQATDKKDLTQAGNEQKPFAVFDIDGTLVRWQLYHAVVNRLAKDGALGEDAQSQLQESMMRWKRREDVNAFKQYEKQLIQVYEQALSRISTEHFDKLVQDVIAEYRDQVYTYTRDLIASLKKQGYFLLIISGSHHELIEQLARYYKFDDWIGSDYKRSEKTFSGEKYLPNFEKGNVLDAFVKKHSLSYADSYAVGDTGSDIAMLEKVENPIAFNPEAKLLAAAKKHKWPIVIERKSQIYRLENHDGEYRLV